MKKVFIVLLILVTVSLIAQETICFNTYFLSSGRDTVMQVVKTTGATVIGVKDTLLALKVDLSLFPGTDAQKLYALQHPGERVLVSQKDTIIYSQFLTTVSQSQKNTYIVSSAGKTLKDPISELQLVSKRVAWEFYLLYLYMILFGSILYLKKSMIYILLIILPLLIGSRIMHCAVFPDLACILFFTILLVFFALALYLSDYPEHLKRENIPGTPSFTVGVLLLMLVSMFGIYFRMGFKCWYALVMCIILHILGYHLTKYLSGLKSPKLQPTTQ